LKKILLWISITAVLNAASTESQAILGEVSKLRQKYEECHAGQPLVQGIEPKVLVECKNKNKTLSQEIAQKSGVIKSLEQTLTSRDRDYRDTAARNKNLLSQIHTQKVSVLERDMLKRALENAKNELAMSQKALKQAGGIKIVYKDRPVVQEKIVTKSVESNEKITVLQRELSSAQATITNLKSTSSKPIVQEKIVEKVVYKDRPIVSNKVVEKVVYKDRPVVTEKIVYRDKIVEKIVYKDRPIATEKIVYKDRPVVQEKIIEKIVYKGPEPQKNSPKTVLKAEKITPIPSQQVQKSMTNDEIKRRQADKIALEAERKKSTSTLIKKASPSAYRMASNAPIYNAINGSKIDTWEVGRSFTSGTSSAGWVKITGYFVNRVWQSADTELWVKEDDVIRR
jgi:glucan-binding YG repeat protein